MNRSKINPKEVESTVNQLLQSELKTSDVLWQSKMSLLNVEQYLEARFVVLLSSEAKQIVTTMCEHYVRTIVSDLCCQVQYTFTCVFIWIMSFCFSVYYYYCCVRVRIL
jgi:hypothetical protein